MEFVIIGGVVLLGFAMLWLGYDLDDHKKNYKKAMEILDR